VNTLPILPTDPGDRNRTSPFAFTGNRFEFRAPGALQSIAGPMTTINTILAEALDHIATELEAAFAKGDDFNTAVQKVLEEIISNHGAVVFNGDGYSDEWQVEAAARGLLNLRTAVDALPQLISEPATELFSKYEVFSDREIHSRYEIALEQYILHVAVEAKTLLSIAQTEILPAAVRYQTEIATNLAALKSVGATVDTAFLNSVSELIGSLQSGIAALKTELAHGHASDPLAEAGQARDGLLPAMSTIRDAADQLEGLVADDLWPLPTYQEMLFIL
jgi:glutamine synthetase